MFDPPFQNRYAREMVWDLLEDYSNKPPFVLGFWYDCYKQANKHRAYIDDKYFMDYLEGLIDLGLMKKVKNGRYMITKAGAKARMDFIKLEDYLLYFDLEYPESKTTKIKKIKDRQLMWWSVIWAWLKKHPKTIITGFVGATLLYFLESEGILAKWTNPIWRKAWDFLSSLFS